MTQKKSLSLLVSTKQQCVIWDNTTHVVPKCINKACDLERCYWWKPTFSFVPVFLMNLLRELCVFLTAKLNAHYTEQFLQDLIGAIPHRFTKTNPDWMSELNDKCLHYTQLSKSNARAKYKTLSALKSISHWLLKTSQQPAKRHGATGLRCWHSATSRFLLRLPVALFRHTSLSWQPYCCAKASIWEYVGSLIWIYIWIS